MDRFEIILPWPDKILSPNDRSHWVKKAKAKAKAKHDAYYLAGQKPPGESFHLLITFCPPDNRSRDIDNCLASCKAALDGIAERWGVNDKLFSPITICFGPVMKGGAVKIEMRDSL